MRETVTRCSQSSKHLHNGPVGSEMLLIGIINVILSFKQVLNAD